MNLKRILLLVTLSSFISIGTFASNPGVKINIDGVALKTDTPAQIVNGRTLVPARAIFDKYGIKTEWYGRPRVVSAYRFDEEGPVWLDMKLGIDSNMATINSSLKYLDQAPIIINGRTMVPLRFVSEVLGSDVTWNQNSKTVNIIKKPINIEKEKDYEKAFTSFLYKGELQNILQKSYKTNYFPITNDSEFSFYDIDKDNVPELLMTYYTGHSSQRAIFEFKNGKISTLFNELEKTSDAAMNWVSHEFYHDPLKKELYSLGNEKYTNWVERYTKQYGFKWIYEDSSAGGGDTIYYDPNFNEESMKELKMQPFHNIDYHDEGHYEPE